MAYEFKVTRRVEFSETDMAGLMHYSNFFKFMETAEHAFYRSLGFSVRMLETDPRLGWPRVHAECDFKKPVRFEDELEVHLMVARKGNKSITYQFRFRRLDSSPSAVPGRTSYASPPVEVARGLMTIVCVAHHKDGSMASVPIPPEIAAKIEPAPEAVLAT
jgi:acyl-CoA thioester hydrolase